MLGASFVLVFLQRLVAGSVLPVGFPMSSEENERPVLPMRISILIFAMLAVAFFTACVSALPVIAVLPKGRAQLSNSIFTLSGGIQSLFLLVLALLIVGSAGLDSVRHAFRLTSARFLGWALATGVIIGFLLPALGYVLERSHWTSLDVAKAYPPQISDLLVSDASWLGAFGLILVAICEEIVVRGMLQPRLTARFGLHGGIIFTAAI
jgi:membrane protease YdiL (CAAX protease family)